jgi:hypothetical protein
MTSPSISFVLRARVELLAELHDVDLRLTQRRANRRRGRGFGGHNLQLDVTRNFLRRCHFDSFEISF